MKKPCLILPIILYILFIQTCYSLQVNENFKETMNLATEEESQTLTWIVNVLKIVGSLICLTLSGMFSGLTLGLLGLDKVSLDIVASSGTPKEQKYANRIKPVRRRGNLLLATLLLGNVMVNSALSILTSDLTTGWLGFALSTILITLFGEIIPQALCARYGLFVGAHTTFILYVFLVLLFPVAFPLSWVLDRLLGAEIGTIYSNEELKRLIEIHATHKKGELKKDEARILGGALDYAKKTVEEIMTPIKDAFMLESSCKLDVDTMTKIWQTGLSRIPIYEKDKNKIVGMLLAKDLMLIDPDDELPVRSILSFYGREVIKVFPDTHLDDLMRTFKSGKCHLAMVHNVVHPEDGDPYYVTLGLVTLEDVIEEILRDEIIDESDVIRFDESSRTKRMHMSTFARKGMTSRLSPKQIVAVASFLVRNVDPFKFLSEELLHNLLKAASVVNLKYDPKHEEYFYKRGEEANFFVLVLSGKVEVVSGIESFISELGPWSVIGTSALMEQQSFIPDFDAKIAKNTKLLKITKEEYIKLVQNAYLEKRFVVTKDMEWMIEGLKKDSVQNLSTSEESQKTESQENETTNLQEIELKDLPEEKKMDEQQEEATIEEKETINLQEDTQIQIPQNQDYGSIQF